jgi:hypothetical protein
MIIYLAKKAVVEFFWYLLVFLFNMISLYYIPLFYALSQSKKHLKYDSEDIIKKKVDPSMLKGMERFELKPLFLDFY